MNDQIPDEDRFLAKEIPMTIGCVHDFVDAYNGGGLSKRTPDVTVLVFFCKKCLEIRKKNIDSSDVLIGPDTLDMYEDDV